VSRPIICALVAVVLGGCGLTAPNNETEDGSKGHIIRCPGPFFFNSWGVCDEKAGELCGRAGYVVLQRYDERDVGPNGTTNNRTMTIQCKGKVG
jgi:hypothetical protein